MTSPAANNPIAVSSGIAGPRLSAQAAGHHHAHHTGGDGGREGKRVERPPVQVRGDDRHDRGNRKRLERGQEHQAPRAHVVSAYGRRITETEVAVMPPTVRLEPKSRSTRLFCPLAPRSRHDVTRSGIVGVDVRPRKGPLCLSNHSCRNCGRSSRCGPRPPTRSRNPSVRGGPSCWLSPSRPLSWPP